MLTGPALNPEKSHLEADAQILLFTSPPSTQPSPTEVLFLGHVLYQTKGVTNAIMLRRSQRSKGRGGAMTLT
jgi:hypothetical protein